MAPWRPGPSVTICDVGPRDGLQNEPHAPRADGARSWSTASLAAGLPRSRSLSFVDPRRVPQMAAAEEVVTALDRQRRRRLRRPRAERARLRAARAAGLDEVRVRVRSDRVVQPQRNQNASRWATRSKRASGSPSAPERTGSASAITISVAFGCPFEGAVDPSRVLELAAARRRSAPDSFVLADTIGVAAPRQCDALVERAVELGVPVGGHFHNTRNTGYANAVAALEAGRRVLDASVGGLGGCPFAPRATGNIATEDLVYLLTAKGSRPESTSTRSSGCPSGSKASSRGSSRATSYRAGAFRLRPRARSARLAAGGFHDAAHLAQLDLPGPRRAAPPRRRPRGILRVLPSRAPAVARRSTSAR